MKKRRRELPPAFTSPKLKESLNPFNDRSIYRPPHRQPPQIPNSSSQHHNHTTVFLIARKNFRKFYFISCRANTLQAARKWSTTGNDSTTSTWKVYMRDIHNPFKGRGRGRFCGRPRRIGPTGGTLRNLLSYRWLWEKCITSAAAIWDMTRS